MKNKEELKNLKEEVENESKKPHELSEEELEQVNGGVKGPAVVVQKILTIDLNNSTSAVVPDILQ